MNKKFIFSLLIFLFSNFSIASNENKYNEIIENLRCLVCQNQSLSESDSDLAKDLRLKVKKMVDQGIEADIIYKFMSSRYTDYVLYNPPVKKSTWFLWYSPFIILLISFFYIFINFRRNKKEKITKDFNYKDAPSFTTKIKNFKIKYFYISLIFIIPIVSFSIYLYSSELMRYKIQYFFESKNPTINITISIHNDLVPKITGNEILFVYARNNNGMRIPLAINIFNVKKLKRNYNVVLDNTMYMLSDHKLSSANEVVVTAKIAKHKLAKIMPGDYIGESLPFKLSSENYLLLNIDSIVMIE